MNRPADGLGSSDAAPAIALSPWRTQMNLYLEKTGELERDDRDTPATYWGRVLESVVADEYVRLTGDKVRRRPTLRSRTHPWMFASLDRTVDGARVIVECKTSGPWQGDEWGEPGTDEVPAHYLAQCYHQLAVARSYELVRIPVLFLAQRRLEIYEVARDDRMIKRLIEAEREFWRKVEARDPTGLRSEPADVRAMYPRDDGTEIEADDRVHVLTRELAEVKAMQARYKRQRDQLEAEIQAYMAEHQVLMGADGAPLATWKTQTSRVIDTAALAAEHSDLVDEYRVDRRTRRFLLKLQAEHPEPEEEITE